MPVIPLRKPGVSGEAATQPATAGPSDRRPNGPDTPNVLKLDVKSLLDKVSDWQIDQRGAHAPQPVAIYLGWNASSGREAQMLLEVDNRATLQTSYELPAGEPVRIERNAGSLSRSVWGTVEAARPGRRTGEAETGIWIISVSLRATTR